MSKKIELLKNNFKTNWQQFINEGKECIKQFKNPQTRYKQIPNLFTASRLLAPFFIIPTALLGNLPLTGIFVVGFAITDAADGYFARKYDATSEFGRKLDALTDKLFAGSLLIPLVFTNPLLLTVLTMEAVISSVNVYSQLSNNTPKTEVIGKIKTAVLFGTIGLNYINLVTHLPNISLNIMTYATVALQTLSTAKYIEVLSKKEHEKVIMESKKNSESSEEEREENNENEKVMTLDPTDQTLIVAIDNSEVKQDSELSPEERARQLREVRAQLTYQEPAESTKQKKIGTQN